MCLKPLNTPNIATPTCTVQPLHFQKVAFSCSHPSLTFFLCIFQACMRAQNLCGATDLFLQPDFTFAHAALSDICAA